MSRRRIIIDTDPGPDDAIALLLALAMPHEVEILAITTVAGNVPVAQTTVNALKMTTLARRPWTPVHRGCPRPLLRPLITAEFIAGKDGLAGMSLPEPTIEPAAGHAVFALIEHLRRSEPRSVTLCTLGPLTNVALALTMAPEIAEAVDRIVMMGGARDLGNVTAAAEYNVYVDPHAAAVVFASGIEIVMFALNATHQALATAPRIERFNTSGGAVCHQVVSMLTRKRPSASSGSADGHPIHDPCVIAYVLWPELFTGRDCRVDMEVAPGPTLGRTTIDWWGRSGEPANAHVIETLDADELFSRIAAAIGTLDA